MSGDVQHYVCGFMFDRVGKRVVLIQKDHPAGMAGKWIGVGGHVEPGETPIAAMAREFQEETSVTTTWHYWEHFARLEYPGGVVHCYRAFDDVAHDGARTTTSEPVDGFWIYALPRPLWWNTEWLIHMALSLDNENAETLKMLVAA